MPSEARYEGLFRHAHLGCAGIFIRHHAPWSHSAAPVPIESVLWNIGPIAGSVITGTLLRGVVDYGWGMPATLAAFAAMACAA